MTSPPPLFDSPGPQAASFTRRDLLTLLFKHKGLILGLWLAVTLLAGFGFARLPPTYVAEAKLLIKPDLQGRPSLLSGLAAYREGIDSDPSNRKLETEMEVLASRPLAAQVVTQLALQYDQAYHPAYVHLLAPVGTLIEWVKTRWFDAPPADTRRFNATVDSLLKSLTIAPARGRGGEATPNLIEVRLLAADPVVAEQALVLLVAKYQQFATGVDQADSERVYHLVKARAELAAQAVQEAQQQVQRQLAGSGGGAAPALVATPQASQIGTPEPGAVRDTEQASAQSSAETVLAVLRRRVLQLELELAEQQRLYTPKMEVIALTQASLADARARYDREVKRAAREGDELATRQRTLRLAEERYFELQRKLSQIELFLQMNPEQAPSRVLIEPPREPESSEWKKNVVLAVVASIAGLMLGLAAASLREFNDHRLSRVADAERHLGLPVLAVVERLRPRPLRRTLGLPGERER